MIHDIAKATEKENGRKQQPPRMVGGFLIIMGVAWSILQFLSVENWWASFIYVGAALFFAIAWKQRETDQPLLARMAIGIGVIVTTVATLFLFDFDWQVWWPAMLIVPGVVLWFNGRLRPNPKEKPVLHSIANFTSWAGGAVFLLGLTFLAHTCQWIDLGQLFGAVGWWGFFMILPGIGNWLSVARSRQQYGPTLLLMWNILSAILVVEGALHLLSLYDWSIFRLLSFLFMTSGVALIAYRFHVD